MKLNDRKYKERVKDICEGYDMILDECDMTSSEECDMTSSKECDITSSEECDVTLSKECDMTSSGKCDMTSSEECDITSPRKCDMTSSEECDVTSSRKCNMTSSGKCNTTSSRECNIASDDYDMICESSCKTEEKPHISIRCDLRVELDNKNKVIYLSPRRVQYFTFKALKSCGEVWINHKGDRHCLEIVGRLGRYKIVGNGVVVYTKWRLNPRDVDILHFTVKDKCTDSCINFAAVFSYNPYNYCKECNK